MNADESFTELMARLREGDDEAAAAVFRHFVRRLIAFTRGQLDTWVRLKTDPEDVVQSVYKSFFARYEAGQFAVADWDGLWGLLTRIAVRKCVNRVHFWQAARRESSREVSLSSGEISPEGNQLRAREPTPAEAAALTETLEQLMQGLPAFDREVLVLHLQGHDVPAISTQVARSERTVRRALEVARLRLCALSETDGPPGVRP